MDPHSNHAPLLGRSGISGIDPAFNSNARGNVTKVTRWLNTGGSVDSYSQYDIAGNVVKSIDPLGNLTQIDYSSSFQYAYPTTTTSPVPDPSGVHGSSSHLITTTNYDFNAGKPVSMTDPNGQVTGLSYNEPLDRLTSISYPNSGGSTLFLYTDSVPNPTVETRRDKDTTNNAEGQVSAICI